MDGGRFDDQAKVPMKLQRLGLAVIEELRRPVTAIGLLVAERKGGETTYNEEVRLPDDAFWALRELEGIARARLYELTGDERHATDARPEILGVVAAHLEKALGSERLAELAVAQIMVVVQSQRIVRGYLDTVRGEPALTPQRTPVLYFSLLKVDDYGHLMRENHGFGYHYHYSDDSRRRADILLTFSRDRITDALTWEPHAVNNADFPARVKRWGNGKRRSVQAVCDADLGKRRIADYLRPGKDASFLIL